MATCGIDRIDRLFAGDPSAGPIGPGDADKDAVGAVQDLLAGHGKRDLPNLLSPAYGLFGPKTTQAVREFCATNGLPIQGTVEGPLLQQMVRAPASDPRASRVYLALALDVLPTGLAKLLSLVSLMEGQGRFAALNLNTDRAGLSFGIIQWAQKPGRLSEILLAFREASPGEFNRIFGASDSRVADGLITHTRRPSGGVNAATGATTDPAYDLIAEPWVGRFKEAAALPLFQAVQVGVALSAFKTSYEMLRSFAPDVGSERGVAFLIDLANQHGDAGARQIYSAARTPGMTEKQVLQAMVEGSVRKMAAEFQDATRRRRELFVNSNVLSDGPFQV